MTTRREARTLALQAMFQMDVGQQTPENALENVLGDVADSSANSYVKEIVHGAWKELPLLDRVIASRSSNWKLDRLNRVDRTILRLALYEMLFREDIPPPVAINEAVELAHKYGGDDSGRFVNGILGSLVFNQGSAIDRERIMQEIEQTAQLHSNTNLEGATSATPVVNDAEGTSVRPKRTRRRKAVDEGCAHAAQTCNDADGLISGAVAPRNTGAEIPHGVSCASTKDENCAAMGVSGHKEARGNASFRIIPHGAPEAAGESKGSSASKAVRTRKRKVVPAETPAEPAMATQQVLPFEQLAFLSEDSRDFHENDEQVACSDRHGDELSVSPVDDRETELEGSQAPGGLPSEVGVDRDTCEDESARNAYHSTREAPRRDRGHEEARADRVVPPSDGRRMSFGPRRGRFESFEPGRRRATNFSGYDSTTGPAMESDGQQYHSGREAGRREGSHSGREGHPHSPERGGRGQERPHSDRGDRGAFQGRPRYGSRGAHGGAPDEQGRPGSRGHDRSRRYEDDVRPLHDERRRRDTRPGQEYEGRHGGRSSRAPGEYDRSRQQRDVRYNGTSNARYHSPGEVARGEREKILPLWALPGARAGRGGASSVRRDFASGGGRQRWKGDLRPVERSRLEDRGYSNPDDGNRPRRRRRRH